MLVRELKPTANTIGGTLFYERFLECPDSPTKAGRGQLLRYWNGDFYCWDKGIYEKAKDIKLEITDYLMEKEIEVKTTLINDIEKVLKVLAGLQSSVELNSWVDDDGARVVAAQNGNISFDDLDENDRPKLLPHCTEYFTLSRLAFDYNPDAECIRWLEFLFQVMQGDFEKMVLLQKWAGYLISNDNSFQKFLLCVGDGANGKSVFFEMMERLIGRENCSHIPLALFGERFGLEATIGKTLIAVNESCSKLDSAAEMMLKSYTGGDTITIQRKFKQAITIKPSAKVMIATNSLPRFEDKSSGLWRRMMYVDFAYRVPEDKQDPKLIEKLTDELSGIFNWAYKGWVLLQEEGFKMPKSCKLAVDQYKKEMNPARTFLEENYCFDELKDGVKCSKVYQMYSRWCKDSGYHAMNAANFGKEVKRVFPYTERKRLSVGGKRPYVYHGIAVSPDSEVEDYP